MTTTLTNTNARNVHWSGREKIEWVQLSAWANTQTHIYSININTSAFTSHMQKHLSTSHVNMSQGLQCHYIPMQTVFFPLWRHSWCNCHVITQDEQHEQERHEHYCRCHCQKTAEIIHNELIKPGTNTGNKATKKHSWSWCQVIVIKTNDLHNGINGTHQTQWCALDQCQLSPT